MDNKTFLGKTATNALAKLRSSPPGALGQEERIYLAQDVINLDERLVAHEDERAAIRAALEEAIGRTPDPSRPTLQLVKDLAALEAPLITQVQRLGEREVALTEKLRIRDQDYECAARAATLMQERIADAKMELRRVPMMSGKERNRVERPELLGGANRQAAHDEQRTYLLTMNDRTLEWAANFEKMLDDGKVTAPISEKRWSVSEHRERLADSLFALCSLSVGYTGSISIDMQSGSISAIDMRAGSAVSFAPRLAAADASAHLHKLVECMGLPSVATDDSAMKVLSEAIQKHAPWSGKARCDNAERGGDIDACEVYVDFVNAPVGHVILGFDAFRDNPFRQLLSTDNARVLGRKLIAQADFVDGPGRDGVVIKPRPT